LIDQQSAEPNIEKRKKIVWEIEKKLIEDDVRPILFYTKAANCRRPQLKNLTTQVNSIYNSWRFEDLWLDRAVGSSSAAK
jgi:peptide/nickel transport system substrate-binding protein